MVPAVFLRPSNRASIVLLAIAAALTVACSLITLDHMKDVVVDASLHGRAMHLASLAASLRARDIGLCVLAAVAVLALPWLEWRHGAYGHLLATMTDAQGWAVLTILLAWLGHAYLGSGVLLAGDMGTHVGRFLEVARGLDAGELAPWTNYQYAGAPLLWFTGPLTYLVGGLLAFVVRDAMLATKILLFALHMLGGWLYFALLRRLGVRIFPAVLVAEGFAGSFAHLHLFLYRGTVPQALTIVCLVLLFYGADGLCRGKATRWGNCLAVSFATAGLIINHQPHALFAAAYLAMFGGVALLTGFWQSRGLPILTVAGLLGAAASMVAVVPVLFEADRVMIQPGGAMLALHAPTLHRLLDLLVWRNTRTNWGIDYWAYLGLGLIGFGAAGIAGTLRKRAGMAGFTWPALICFITDMFLHNPVVRDIVFLLFFLGLLAAAGLDRLAGRRLSGPALLVVTCIVLLDLASTSVQPVARNDKGFLIEAGHHLQRDAPNQRVMQIGIARIDGALQADIGPDGNPLSYDATVQRIAGNHNMAATHIHNFLVSTSKLAERDLRATGRLSPDARALLGIFNVARVICNNSVANGCPAALQDTAEDPVLGRYLPITAAPALFSSRLVFGAPAVGLEKPMLWPDDFAKTDSNPRIAAIEATLRRFLALENPDIPAHTAHAIAVRDAGRVSSTADAAAPWHTAIRAYDVGLDTVRLRVQTDRAGYVQMAHPWFASTRVTIGGKPVRPLRGMIDLIVLPIPTGISEIELRAGSTWVETLSLIGTLLGLAGCLLFGLMIRRHDRSWHHAPVTASETGPARETVPTAVSAASTMET